MACLPRDRKKVENTGGGLTFRRSVHDVEPGSVREVTLPNVIEDTYEILSGYHRTQLLYDDQTQNAIGMLTRLSS